MKNFAKQLPSNLLNIEEKNRSNLFAWRGQFSPQLVECLLQSYCLPGSVVLDPFAGSGTVLYEAAAMSLPAYGFEINPAAWCFSKLYEFTNTDREARRIVLKELRHRIGAEFPIILFTDDNLDAEVVESKIISIGSSINDHAKILCNALVVLLDVYNNPLTNGFVQGQFNALAELVTQLPFSDQPIKADLQDARALPLESESVDFALTSPPYINVFNYHQNYRRSVELLGWDLLRVARSEIGSNRANRGNRFFTVVQYCIDMTRSLSEKCPDPDFGGFETYWLDRELRSWGKCVIAFSVASSPNPLPRQAPRAIQELSRVIRRDGRAILIVGHESRVLGAPFYNADILERIARQSGMFNVVLRQERVFVNRFGQNIREGVLNLTKVRHISDATMPLTLGRAVALDALKAAQPAVSEKNSPLLHEAVERVAEVEGTPLFNSSQYTYYQTREYVMMVKEEDK